MPQWVIQKIKCVNEIARQICPDDRQEVYLGETARNLNSRGRELVSNYEKKGEEYLIVKH